MKLIAALSVAGLLLTAGSAAAGIAAPHEPDMVAATCSPCHGNRGISRTSWFPNLAGQTRSYLETQLQNFRDHQRGDHYARAYMWSIAGALSDKTAARVAAYFASLPPPKGSASGNPARVATGRTIFKQGVASEGVPACGACHGDDAAGTSMAPRLAGQHREYLVAQLKAFRSNARNNAIMHGNVEHMTDKQMRDIAAYLASL